MYLMKSALTNAFSGLDLTWILIDPIAPTLLPLLVRKKAKVSCVVSPYCSYAQAAMRRSVFRALCYYVVSEKITEYASSQFPHLQPGTSPANLAGHLDSSVPATSKFNS